MTTPILFQCVECGFHYTDNAQAKKCEAWCKEHHSCNIVITASAIENKKGASLVFGSTNPAKLEQIRMALSGTDIEVHGLDPRQTLPTIAEDGETAQENAHTKAVAYAKALGQPILSMDAALFFQSNPDDEQPGVHIRRIPGRTDRPTDEEIVQFYQAWINRLGGMVNGHYEFAFCIANPNGEHCEASAQTPVRIFTSTPSQIRIPGYPLESLSMDPTTGHYISEMTQEEIRRYWQTAIGAPLTQLVQACPFLYNQ